MPIKTLGSLGKIRVGRVTGNTHIFFFCLMWILLRHGCYWWDGMVVSILTFVRVFTAAEKQKNMSHVMGKRFLFKKKKK